MNDQLITTKAASKILGICELQVRNKLAPDKIQYLDGNITRFFYYKNRIIRFLEDSMVECRKCGKIFSNLGVNKTNCKECSQQIRIKDSKSYDYNLLSYDGKTILNKCRGRICPVCKKNLVVTGQYKCRECAILDDSIDLGLVNDNYVY